MLREGQAATEGVAGFRIFVGCASEQPPVSPSGLHRCKFRNQCLICFTNSEFFAVGNGHTNGQRWDFGPGMTLTNNCPSLSPEGANVSACRGRRILNETGFRSGSRTEPFMLRKLRNESSLSMHSPRLALRRVGLHGKSVISPVGRISHRTS